MSAANTPYAVNHISVDSVIFGYDGRKLMVLLLPEQVRMGREVFRFRKLPGDLILREEDLEEAVHRIVRDLTGIDVLKMIQIKTYGSKGRTSEMDMRWLLQNNGVTIDGIVTTSYLSVVKINRQLESLRKKFGFEWTPVQGIEQLAFDHNRLIEDGLALLKNVSDATPEILFDLLPRKFTIPQYRLLCEQVHRRPYDPGNFQKKVLGKMPYVLPLEEFETGTGHRAARYHRFDKTAYKRLRK